MSENEITIAGLKINSDNNEIKKKAFELLKEIRSLSFATSENNSPEVRVIDLMDIDERGIYFLTARGKHFYKQIMSSPEVAVTGLTKDYISVRIKGWAKKTGPDERESVINKNPRIKKMYGDAESILEVFNIYRGTGEIFDLSTSRPKRLRFAFGGAKPANSAYFITEKCTGCGECRNICPEDAIEEGEPYRIIDNICLECGSCFEICPVEAIIYRK